MDINIKQSECRFIIKEEERKVICIMENTENFVYQFFEIFHKPYFMSNSDWNFLTMPNRFTGIATCNSEDEFNEEFGRKLAFYKMKEKLCTSFFKRAQVFVDSIGDYHDKVCNNANELGTYWSLNCKNLSEEINKYLKDDGKTEE